MSDGDRAILMASPIGGNDVAFERMTGTETLGRPFEFDVDMVSANGDLSLADALGKPLTVALSMGTLGARYFNGIVVGFALTGWIGSQYRYRARLCPWLWLLTRTSNSRVFHNQTVPQILSTIFDDHGFSGLVDASGLNAHMSDFKPHEYLVQYNESDFNFVSRLMELEGIYYAFKHEADKHTLVLSTGTVAADQTVPGYATIPYFVGDAGSAESQGHEHVSAWSVGVQIEPRQVVLRDFNYMTAGAPVVGTSPAPASPLGSTFETFQYPGLYLNSDDLAAHATLRLQQEQMGAKVLRGTANARGITPGKVFKLTDHPAQTQNAQYLVIGASYDLEANAQGSGATGTPRDFGCMFDAIEVARVYRTPPATTKPRVEGPQTAIVVGQDGPVAKSGADEIFTDTQARVKVLFHWVRPERYQDAQGKPLPWSDKSSCWVRVSQTWAGNGWGALHPPRIGQEVIIDFLEGDPDRPIITGRVYNNTQIPPYANAVPGAPQSNTASGIRSRSTPQGSQSNYNEIRFEDKKGSEELHVQAEKDHSTTVKNNRSASVGGSDTVTVGGDRTEKVHGSLSITVDGKGKAPHSNLEVTGKHHVHATDTIEMEAETHIQFKVGGSVVLIEPKKITLTAGDGAEIVLDPNVLAHSKKNSKVVLDENALMQSSDGSRVLLDPHALMQSKAGPQVLLTDNALLQADGKVVTVDGKTVQVTGATEASMVGGGAGGGSVDATAAGVAVTGTQIKLNS
ncbi:MAG TPA: type VI secretion system tip protein TssI/VgrG [Polyangia bacterium]|nr:type VI secretion system tip protein TssI/VgrG [Polyangia bacterium]